MTDSYELMKRIENRVAELPAGYISRKNINGIDRYYLQWREEGKVKSKYIRESELELFREQIEERKRLQARLKEFYNRLSAVKKNVLNCETNVTIGANLERMVRRVK